MNTQSEQINELAGALAKAQGQITGALKDSANPFFKSKYADLASCWDAARKPLSDNGLAVIQSTVERDGQIYVVTTLAHSSGQWLRGWLPIKAKDDGPQAQGSGLTYARRYALAAMVGLAQVDDDAEGAQARHHDSSEQRPPGVWPAQSRSASKQRPQRPAEQSSGTGVATDKQIGLVRMKLDKAEIPEGAFLEEFGVDDLTALPFAKVNDALAWIADRAN